MLVTKEWLDAHKTSRGSWNKRQIEALGYVWPPTKGWKNRVVGMMLSSQQQQAFESGGTSKGSRVKSKELQQQIIGLNKKVVELQDQERRIKELEHQMAVVLANLNIVF